MLAVIEMWNIDSFTIKDVIMQGIEDTHAEAEDLCFSSADSGVKFAFDGVNKTAFTNIFLDGLVNELIHNRFKRLSQLRVLVNK